jgi:hypothetical protein
MRSVRTQRHYGDMGPLCDYFIAQTDEEAAETIDRVGGPAPRQRQEVTCEGADRIHAEQFRLRGSNQLS